MIEFKTNSDYLVVEVTARKEFKEIELLLLARSIPFTSKNDIWQKAFFVPLDYESFTRSEIANFVSENKNWPPIIRPEKTVSHKPSGIHLLILGCLAYFHWYTTRIAIDNSWLDSGRFVAHLVLDGEIWRLFTALTLHVDDAHLFSNLVGLLVFVSVVNYYLGPGLSWSAVLVSGALGNFFNALFFQVDHHSIGASTAVFSAVGLISVFGIKHYVNQRRIRGRYLIPLMGGVGIFAMLGTSPETDVMAHFFGFLGGNLLGLLFIPFIGNKKTTSITIQLIGLILFASFLFVSWKTAFLRVA